MVDSKIELSLSIIIFLFLNFQVSTLVETQEHHPLDPLTPFELNQVQTLVKKQYQNATFHFAGLDEPDKNELLSQNPPFVSLAPRRAFVIARVESESHEFIIDLSEDSIISDKIYHGNGYPMLNIEEQTIASELPLNYAQFKASIAKRGLDLSEIVCEAFTIGWYGAKEMKRVVTILCYYISGTFNFYMRPIEGISTTVDLDEMKIVDYRDRMVVPIPKVEGTDYRELEQYPPFDSRIKGMTMLQPDGPSFTLDGQHVRYDSFFLNVSNKLQKHC